jgi:glycosyltransferase involved in cell wall biosynthesis
LKKVLIITYYWPPSGGAGVQRWLKFAKYLRDFAWEPVVFTVCNGEFPEQDLSLLPDVPDNIEVLKQPIWEPYLFYKFFTGKRKNDKIHAGFLSEKKQVSLMQQVAVWIRGNFFIPDARMFWIKPSIKTLSAYLKKKSVDAIVTTGPPHSCHLIGLALHTKFNIPWLADFRDPWTNIDFYKELKLTQWADNKHHRLEKKVIETADSVLTIGHTMQQEFAQQFGRTIDCITNGFDEADCTNEKVKMDITFSISHIGTMVKTRNPVVLWKALQALLIELPDLKNHLEIKLVGKVDHAILASLQEHALTPFITIINYLTHADVIKAQHQSQLLLLVVNDTPNSRGVITGKIFEYLLAKRPILCIGPPDGDAAYIVQSTHAGQVVNFDELEKTKNVISDYFQKFKQNNLHCNSTGIEAYNRKNLTQQLATILNSITRHD